MYTIDKMWNSPAANDEQITSVQISLFYRLENGEWSAAIPGIGGSKLVAKESSGLHSNDEAVKMATTDALGVAMKHLGVAADVYMGLWDGSKYIEPKDAPNFPKTVNTPKEAKKAVKEAVPQAGMKPVDEAFPKDSPSEDLLVRRMEAERSQRTTFMESDWLTKLGPTANTTTTTSIRSARPSP
jgi:hypothetical protein